MDMERIREFTDRYRVYLMAGFMGFLLMTSLGLGSIYGSNKICKDSGGLKVINPEGAKVCVIKANVQRDYCISLNEGLNTVYFVPQTNLSGGNATI